TAVAADPRARARAVGGRLLTELACVVLLVLAWPGWLHSRVGDPRAPHRVAWRIDVDPALRQAAETLAELHPAGLVHKAFATHPDVAHYCAWFGPGARLFFAYRFALYPGVAAEAGRVRQDFRKETDLFLKGKPLPPRPVWQKVFLKYQVDYVVLG